MKRPAAALVWLALSAPAVDGGHAAEAPPAAPDMAVVLKLSNLTDATPEAETKRLETGVKKVAGVKDVLTRRKRGEVRVTYKAGTDIALIRKAVTTAGFTIVDPKPAPGAVAPNPATPSPAPSAPPPAPAATPK
ncbi:MAG: hypothetical protein HY903_12770 [Deltaproteobacteria bacterium]|nr:hypothetical protein [Deltaproteobacteria bacterium]